MKRWIQLEKVGTRMGACGCWKCERAGAGEEMFWGTQADQGLRGCKSMCLPVVIHSEVKWLSAFCLLSWLPPRLAVLEL